jgi:PAS domain S-box-containing protein
MNPAHRSYWRSFGLAVLGASAGWIWAAMSGPSEGSPHLVLPATWVLAIFAACGAIVAALPWRQGGDAAAYLAVTILAVVASSQALAATALWRLLLGLDARAAVAVDAAESSLRLGCLAFWLVILLPPVARWLERRPRRARLPILALGAGLAVVWSLIWAAPDSPLFGRLRSMPMTEALLWVLMVVDLALLAYHVWGRPAAFARRLLLAGLPFAAAQVLVLLGYSFALDPAVLALRALALFFTLLAVGGLTLGEVRRAALVDEQLRRMRSDLDLQAQEMERVDRALAHQERETETALAAVEQRDRIVQSIAVATGHLLESGGVDDGLRAALGVLGEATFADRVVYQPVDDPNREPGERSVVTWSRGASGPSGSVAGGVVDRLSTADLGEPAEALRRGEAWVGSADALSPRASAALHEAGTSTLAIVPVRVSGRAVGVLRFETAAGREWTTTELDALNAAARALGATLERDRFLHALEHQSASYRELIDSASDLILAIDGDGRFLFVNPAWCAALGYGEEQSRSLTLWDVVPERFHAFCREELARLEAGEAGVRLDIAFRSSTGEELEVEGRVGGRSVDGRRVGGLGIFRDVGERRRVERMKREFLATVSHELRTPLTSMLGSVGLLRSGRLAQRPEKAQELLEIAERNGDRLLRLINDLLDLQRLEAGELRFVLVPTAIDTVLSEALEGISGMAGLLGVRVALDPEVPRVTLLTDRDRLNQVIYNLLSNAIKFSPRGETVRLQAAVDQGRLEISVTDRGPGIPEAFRARLFEKFAQAEGSSRVGGSGLGLSISKRLVEGLGGSIRIDSREGVGTRASIAFSVTDERASRTAG